MPHFFLPINWVLTPSIIIFALLVTAALIYWAVPKLNFPQSLPSPLVFSSNWTRISESLLLSIVCTFVFQTNSFVVWNE